MSNLFTPEPADPDLRLPFRVILSTNSVMSGATRNNAFALAGLVKKWRRRGRDRAIKILKELKCEIVPKQLVNNRGKVEWIEALKTVYFESKIVCIIRVWRPNNGRWDLPNIFYKPLIDGFCDVGIFHDDSFHYLTDVILHFEGVDTSLKLTAEEKETRKQYKKSYPKRQMPPLPGKFYFDFYKVGRFENCSPIGKIGKNNNDYKTKQNRQIGS